MNHSLRTVIVAPLTTRGRDYPTRVLCRFSGKIGQVVLDQIRTVDQSRLIRKLGRLDNKNVGSSTGYLGGDIRALKRQRIILASSGCRPTVQMCIRPVARPEVLRRACHQESIYLLRGNHNFSERAHELCSFCPAERWQFLHRESRPGYRSWHPAADPSVLPGDLL